MIYEDSNSKKSVSYQKKDGRGHARPSFFWYGNDKDVKVCFLVTCLICIMIWNNGVHFFYRCKTESDIQFKQPLEWETQIAPNELGGDFQQV